MANQTANTSTLKMVNTTTTSSQNITQVFALDDEADDAIWILTSTFIIFTMQSGKLLRFFSNWNRKGPRDMMTTITVVYDIFLIYSQQANITKN